MPFITVTYPPKYPLTESEKKWLEVRSVTEIRCGAYYCDHCEHQRNYLDAFQGYCTLYTDCNKTVLDEFAWADCAEFEARVAAWMADNLKSCDFCDWYVECFATSCAKTRLKHARLAVEAEMEKDR